MNGLNELLYLRAVELATELRFGEQSRSFVDALEVIAVLPHEVEQPGCCVGIAVGCNAGLVKDGFAVGDLSAAHPASQQWFLRFLGQGFEFFGGLGGIGHGLGSQYHQQAVAVGIIHRHFNSVDIPFGVGIPQNVNGITVAPVGR